MNKFSKFALTLFALIIGASQAIAQNAVPLKITGPIAVTAKSGDSYRGSNEQPVAGPGLPVPDLVSVGYVQEEYFISGSVDGQPFATSLLVRKPKDMKRFSGLVGVETIHAAGAIPFWGVGREVWASGGHGWIAVASQRAALENRVKPFNPARYASLSIPEVDPGEGGMSYSQQDRISQAIMTQVGTLLKSNAKGNPFGKAQVRHLLMGGSSQTGGTTLRYIEQSHASARLKDGLPIYDGYLPMEAFSTKRIAGGDAAVIHAVGEGDFALFRSNDPDIVFATRDDSDAPNDRFRGYEFAAAPHVPTRGMLTTGRSGEMPSQFPTPPFYKMALLHLIDWVTKGTVPPRGERMQQSAAHAMLRDEHGNAKGGIRSPWADVPVARNLPSPWIAPEADRAGALRGIQENFANEKLMGLYGTRENYLQKFNQSIDKLVAERWILPADGEKLKVEEAARPPF